MNLNAHILTLKQRHAKLKAKIVEEETRPSPDQTKLSTMKLEKLHLKEEIQMLEKRSELALA
jgi:hypothetical protein